MLVCSGGGVFSPWRRRHTPHGAYPKPTPGYDVIFAILWGSVLLFCWWHLSVWRFCFCRAFLKGCCFFHQPVGLTVCMAVLLGRVCRKICFHRCFAGRYFLWAGLRRCSLNSQNDAGGGEEKGWRGTAAGSSPPFCLLPETVAHSCYRRSYCRESSGGLRGWWGNWSISPMRKGWGSWTCSAWSREGWERTLEMPINICRVGVKRTGPDSFQ